MTRRIDISWKTIIFITAFLVFLWIIWQILDIIMLFFVAFIFMSTLSPVVDKLVKWKIPRVLAVLLVLFLTLAVLIGTIAVGLTPLVTQTSSLLHGLSATLSLLLQSYQIDQSVVQQELPNLSGQAVDITLGIFSNFVSFVTVLVVTVYMLMDRKRIEEYSTSFFGSKKEKAQRILRQIEDKLGAWLRGQLLLSVFVGVLVYLGLLVLGVEFALPLAIIAALLEVVPVIGPIIAAIPAILVALTVSPLLAVLVGGLYLSVQQIEGHLIVPQVMKRAVGLNPLLIILAISVGGRLLGLAGALLAVPIAVVMQLIIQEWVLASETE